MGALENKRLMQEIFAAVAKGDGALFVESLADDATMTVTGQNSWSRTFTGKASILEDLFGYLRTVLAQPRQTIARRFIADGDFVVVEAKGDMVTRAGVRYDNDYCLVYRLDSGKIVEIREYNDSALCERILGAFPSAQSEPPIVRKAT